MARVLTALVFQPQRDVAGCLIELRGRLAAEATDKQAAAGETTQR